MPPLVATIAFAASHPGRVVLVDLFTGSAELVSNTTVASDGFHPSDAGYQLIADRFATAMRAAGVPGWWSCHRARTTGR